MDYTYRERHGEAIYRFKNGMLPSDFFRRNVVLSFQEDAIGIRLRPSLIMLAGHVLCGQVRSGLSPGGRWIRTSGPASEVCAAEDVTCSGRRGPTTDPR